MAGLLLAHRVSKETFLLCLIFMWESPTNFSWHQLPSSFFGNDFKAKYSNSKNWVYVHFKNIQLGENGELFLNIFKCFYDLKIVMNELN